MDRDMDPFNFNAIFRIFGDLISDNPNGGIIIMDEGDGIMQPPCSGGGCDDNNPPSEKSPRDEVLQKPRRDDIYGHNFSNGDDRASLFHRRGRDYGQENSQRDDVLNRPSGPDFNGGGNQPGAFFFSDSDSDNNLFTPNGHFFDPFSGRGNQDAFDDFDALFSMFDPFRPMREHHRPLKKQDEQQTMEDVDLDQQVSSGKLSSLFDGSFSNSSKITTRSDGFFRKRTTWVDSNGNKQVKTVTRDNNGVETEKIEKHLPDGRIETIESKRKSPNPYGRQAPAIRNDVWNDQQIPFHSQSYTDFLKKPLFKSELFCFEKPKTSQSEGDVRDNNTGIRDDRSFGFRRLLNHFLYGD